MPDEPDNVDEAHDAGAANDDYAEDETPKTYDWSAFHDDEGRLYDYNRYAGALVAARGPSRSAFLFSDAIHERNAPSCSHKFSQ
jgi:hypothetical protein